MKHYTSRIVVINYYVIINDKEIVKYAFNLASCIKFIILFNAELN